MNQQAVQIVIDSDLLGYGPESYDTEAADIVAALQGTTHTGELADTIQRVFQFSYEETIPLEKCEKLAQTLLTLKAQVACDI